MRMALFSLKCQMTRLVNHLPTTLHRAVVSLLLVRAYLRDGVNAEWQLKYGTPIRVKKGYPQ